MNVMRTKEEIIEDIRNLVKTKGYVYALCMIVFEDHIVELGTMHKLDLNSRLSIKEVSFLLGFVIQNTMDVSTPTKEDFFGLVKRTRELMQELHKSFRGKFIKLITTLPDRLKSPEGIFSDSDMIVEPIFYSGDGAYDIQYSGFLKEKYKYDADWLLENKNFDIGEMKYLVNKIKCAVEKKQCLRAPLLPLFKERMLSASITEKEWAPFCEGFNGVFCYQKIRFQ